MIYSVLRDFRRRHPEGRISLVCCPFGFDRSPDAARLRRDFPGIEFLPVVKGCFALWRIVRAIRRARATETAILGADCMDGHWIASFSALLFMVADVSAAAGLRTHLTGFSYNASAWPGMARLFRSASPRLKFNLRDAVSLSRFPAPANARLVADAAFLLKSSEFGVRSSEFRLGLNLHMMLPGREGEEWLSRVAEAVWAWCAAACGGVKVRLVLIPHDYRPHGDVEVLQKFKALLCRDGRFAGMVETVEDVLSAAELKAVAGTLDALFTTRMHLGIAALGMGRPVAAFAYQGKFEGLFRHFGLPQELLLAPAETGRLPEVLARLVDEAPALAERIRSRLPEVLRLAAIPFKEMISQD